MMKKPIIVTENINCIYQVNRGDIILIKLVRKVEWELPESPKTEMYMYGEASVEANQEMQEPLGKLYQYENQPNMREKVKEYINELKEEIKRCENKTGDIYNQYAILSLEGRIIALTEVVNDLQGRLDEVI